MSTTLMRLSGDQAVRAVDDETFTSLLGTVRRFVRHRVVPVEAEIERSGRVPDGLLEQAAELGLYGFALPVEHGGLGLTMHQEVRLAFELGHTTTAFRSAFGTNNGIAGQVIVAGGTPAQRDRYLPALASGELVASFALSEPEAGSDPAAITTTARREGGDYLIDGIKRFITNAPRAGVFVVFARTGPPGSGARGISTFLVDAGLPGVEVGPADAKMGQHGSLTADVTFRRVRVPASALIGDEGMGFRAAMCSLDRGRLHIAAVCVGTAERLIEESVAYARERRQFGRSIGRFQLVQAMLADSRTEALAGRSMTLGTAERFEGSPRASADAACCKYFCSEMVGRVADRAVQIHGGNGYMRGVTVERLYRDVRLFRIYEGTSQIQQLVIARAMLGPEGDA